MHLRARLFCAALCLLAASAAHPAATPPDKAPNYAAVQDAVQALKDDRLMGGEHKAQRLRWASSDDKASETAPWLKRVLAWIRMLAGLIGSSARVVVWLLAALGAGILGLVLWRVWRGNRYRSLPASGELPTHVRGLDIRPDALPLNIAEAAQALWMQGDQRGAMVLLYRGLLSRLVHRHHVKIRDSSTEGDCLHLASQQLTGSSLEYVRRYLDTWQRAIYAAQWPDGGDFIDLCRGFPADAEPAGT